jgi:hypothetical protein
LSPLLFTLFFDQLYFYIQSQLNQVGRGSNIDLVNFLSLQVWLLMFADDIVLLALSMPKLSSLYEYVRSFCSNCGLSVNSAKTKLMVSGPASSDYPCAIPVCMGSSFFEVVHSFKYLGLHFDCSASTKNML